VGVFERAEVAVGEQVADERLLALGQRVALDARHHLLEGRVADVLLHVVVAGRLADESLRVLRGLQ
jgi:hypothetical protein